MGSHRFAFMETSLLRGLAFPQAAGAGNGFESVPALPPSIPFTSRYDTKFIVVNIDRRRCILRRRKHSRAGLPVLPLHLAVRRKRGAVRNANRRQRSQCAGGGSV